jgi:hypothetical protein
VQHRGPRQAGSAGSALAAARIAGDQVELWLPGSLAALAFLGWLPFLLAVVPVPSAGDLAFFGANLATSPSYPVNIVLLLASAGLVVVAASILVAAGEAALLRGIGRVLGRAPADRSMDDAAARVWIVQAVAALPAMAAIVLALLRIAAVAPGEYQSPDIGGPLVVRIALDAWPEMTIALVAMVVGVAFGAAAQRAAIEPPHRSLAAAIATGAAAVVRHPVRRLGVAIVTLAVLAGWLAGTWFVLRLLWQPIGAAMAAGRLADAATPILLVGFVAIWLCLVAAGGAVHGWASAWWSLELAEPDPRGTGTPDARAEEADRPWT